MKKLITGIIIASFLLTGCVISRSSTYIIRGAKMSFNLPGTGFLPISGEDVKGVLIHHFYWTNEKGRKTPSPLEIIIDQAGEGNTTDDSITVKESK